MKYWIDNKYYEDDNDNSVIIQKCFENGIDIPCFCYSEALSIAGSCRMCLVEISTSIKLVASCAMPLMDNMKVYTATDRVKKARESVLEFLLVNHPLDCPICDQGGECDLQDITLVFGSDRSRFYEFAKRSVFDKNVGGFVKMIMTRCIHCTRCVRFLNEIVDSYEFGMLGRGVNSEISSFVFKVLSHEMSANVIDLCPVGALTAKPYSFSARPWELNSLESIDILDSMCSHIRLDYLNNKLMRILPIYNKNLNDDWITNKIRFVYDSILYQRINYPLLKVNNDFINVSWVKAFNVFFDNFYKYSKKASSNFCIFLGNLIDLDSIDYVKKFFNSFGIDVFFESYINYFCTDYDLYYSVIDLDFESIKFLLIISLNLRLEMPILNSKLFKYKEKIFVFSIGVVGYYYSSFIKCIGNSMKDVVDIIKGKNIFNIAISKSILFDLKVFYFFFKPEQIQIIIGQSFFNNKDSYFLFNNLIYYTNKFFCFSKCSSLFINVGALNYFNSNYINKKKMPILDNFCFFHGVDSYNFLKNYDNQLFNNFIVYRGSFFDECGKKSDLIFPNLTFFEEKMKYKNFKGFTYFTKNVVSNEIFNNIYFFYFFHAFKFKYFKKNLYNIINFGVLLKYFKFLFINFVNVNYITFSINNKMSVMNIKLNEIENKLFNSFIINYYKTDAYSRNSRNIVMASLEYLKMIITYE